ncbi:hypothetical protein KBY96_07870 [Cyanobium sp. ATX 6A2]|uniref:hypothetical protein n=1 Tax=Cyanobium sp. ATX 6A2 TaxID=2823700 RepID=UPI0020CE340F|nr:hypothetical protein [Cyanobium sp. ATX 6A2]MCP9887847.1 hypothetical protein [Cyanobium sp. ATX 6A2]
MTTPTTTTSDFQRLQQLIRRDRLRKLIVLLLLTGVSGAAIYAQAVWVLAVLASGLAGVTAWQRRRLGK